MKKKIFLMTLTCMFAFATVGFAQNDKKANDPVKKEVKCEKKAECKGEKKPCCKKGEKKACCKK